MKFYIKLFIDKWIHSNCKHLCLFCKYRSECWTNYALEEAPDNCKITVQYSYYDDKVKKVYHTTVQTYTFDDYRICGDVIKLLKEKGIRAEYKDYIEDFRE